MTSSHARRAARRAAHALVLAALLGCEGTVIVPDGPGPGPGPGPGLDFSRAAIVSGHPEALNESERRLVDRLRGLGFSVDVLDDDGFTLDRVGSRGVVVVSKTTRSDNVGARLKAYAGGVLFWEDNMQRLSMLATIVNDGAGGTGWHRNGRRVRIRGDAPSILRGGTSGTIDFYVADDEITFAPAGELTGGGIAIAETERGETAVYVVDPGARLADGTRAAGRRAYFGLYDDTFRLLTPSGLALFDAVARWTAFPP